MGGNGLEVSIVVPTYQEERSDDLVDTVESMLMQSYQNIEVIVVSENLDVCIELVDEFENEKLHVFHFENEEDKGVAAARNFGFDKSSGELVMFSDDDVEADEEWIEQIVDSYNDKPDFPGYGGKVLPVWPDDGPLSWLPEEFYWLIGSTKGLFSDTKEEVRNTYACNMGFQRKHFEELDGFDENFGKNHGFELQGEESEIGSRAINQFGKSVYYNPEAVVYHKVYPEQLEFRYLLERAFLQGMTKSLMSQKDEFDGSQESGFLKNLFVNAVPKYLKNGDLDKVVMTFVLTTSVGLGYLYNKLSSFNPF